MQLAGKKALITGARRNIGRGIAQALAEAGCDVGINDIEQDTDADETLRLVTELGRESAFFRADLVKSGEIETMFKAFLKRFGKIDILVNNAYYTEHKPFLELTEEDWDQTLDVSLKSFFLCGQHAARAMVERENEGCIVNISSVHAKRAWPASTCYGVAKAGAVRLTEAMAVDLGGYGIRCNSILPGYMDTSHNFGSAAPPRGSVPDRMRCAIPSGRCGTPEDIGRAVVFLCSSAGANITGIALPVDGGFLVTAVP